MAGASNRSRSARKRREYIHFDERQDVLASLNLACLLLPKLKTEFDTGSG